MEIQYTCKQNFNADKYDGIYITGTVTAHKGGIHKGDRFKLSESSYRITDETIRLVAVDTEECSWLEISKETLSICFDKTSEDMMEEKR